MNNGFLSNNSEKSMRVIRDCENAIRSQQNDFQRGARSWDVYKAIDGSQYTDKKRQVFKEEGRHPWQFDFASAKVDTLAGTIIAELPDPDWTPIIGQNNTAVEALKESYFIDKELFNYPFAMLEIIRDGCIHCGWGQIEESKKYHPAGNIAITRVRPGYFIPDPYWLTDDDRDLVKAFKIGYYDAEKMKQIWKKKSDEIDRAIFEIKNGRRQEPPDDLYERQIRYESSVGDEYRVIEEHRLEIINTVKLIGLRKNAEFFSAKLSWIPFPLTENRELLQRYAEVNDIDWTTVQEVPFEKRIHRVTTVTDLDPDIILEDGESRIQCNGLPFLHFTTSRANGHDKGIAESISDLQMMFNERMSHVHELIGKASGGSEIWNEELFRDAKSRQRFVKNGNKPGHKEFAPLDDVKRIKEEVGHIDVNPAIFQQVSVIYNELLPIISRVSDTMSAVSNSEDTGILFEKKYQMNRVANILFDKFAKQLINNMGECYYYQWQQTYGDIERIIKARNGKEIVLNKQTDIGIINSVANIPRCRVIVTENYNSATYQMYQRAKIQDIIKNIPPNDYLRLNAALKVYFGNLNLKDEDKAMFDIISEMNDMKAQLQFMTEMLGLKAQMANSQTMIAQAEQLIGRMNQMAGIAGNSQMQQQPVPQQITGPEEQTQQISSNENIPAMQVA